MEARYAFRAERLWSCPVVFRDVWSLGGGVMEKCTATLRQELVAAGLRRGGIARRKSPSTRYGAVARWAEIYLPSRAALSSGVTGLDPNQRLKKARWKSRPRIAPFSWPES